MSATRIPRDLSELTGHVSTGQLPATGVAAGAYAFATVTVDTTGRVVAITAGAAGAASVSNSDGTLTISPTAGAVVASLALSHQNTWTGAQHFPQYTTVGPFGSSFYGTPSPTANSAASLFAYGSRATDSSYYWIEDTFSGGMGWRLGARQTSGGVNCFIVEDRYYNIVRMLVTYHTGMVGIGTGVSDPAAQLEIRTSSPTTTGIVVRGSPSQYADFMQAQDETGATLSAVKADGSHKPAHLADTAATNDSIYYSTTAGKLVYKDSTGTVNNLY
jgi:hypothetical protein